VLFSIFSCVYVCVVSILVWIPFAIKTDTAAYRHQLIVSTDKIRLWDGLALRTELTEMRCGQKPKSVQCQLPMRMAHLAHDWTWLVGVAFVQGHSIENIKILSPISWQIKMESVEWTEQNERSNCQLSVSNYRMFIYG